MRTVFIGASQFGLRCFRHLAGIEVIELVGLVSNPPVFSISYRPEGVRNVLHADLCAAARELGVPSYLMAPDEKMSSPALLEQLTGWQPELILVIGWYHMVPLRIRSLAPTLGMHASLLPEYSGGAPLVWAMIEGETRTGISLFALAEGVDNGPILGQAEVPIAYEDSIASLYARIEIAGLDLLSRHLPELAAGRARFMPQDETLRRIMPQRAPSDGLIDWRLSAKRLYNFIRAQTRPYPGAFGLIGQTRLTIWAARPVAAGEGPAAAIPGQLFRGSSGAWLVRCGQGEALELLEWEAEGGQPELNEGLRLG
ncbi:MAG: methionyl-tRNA formyltransferase [Candidatus Sericytochromatia bacterium]